MFHNKEFFFIRFDLLIYKLIQMGTKFPIFLVYVAFEKNKLKTFFQFKVLRSRLEIFIFSLFK